MRTWRLLTVPLMVAVVTMASSSMVGATAGSGAISPWSDQNENPNANHVAVGQRQAIQDAKNFNLITAHAVAYGGVLPGSRNVTAGMQKANSHLKILLYMNATFAQSYQPPGGPGGFDPTWYEKDASGNYVTNNGTGNYLMDPTNPGWIQYDINECLAMPAGYVGCYLDALGLAPLAAGYLSAFPINSATGQPWTGADWIRATSSLAAAVRTGVHPKFVLGNGLTDGPHFYDPAQPTQPIVNGVDGGVAEAWLRLATAPANAFPSVTAWQQNVDMLAAVEAQGKPCLTLTKLWSSATAAQQTSWQQFALGSFLLGTQGRSAFFFSPSSSTLRTTPFTLYSTNLGAPAAPYAFAQGVYQRPFSSGLVLVNPSTSSVTVALSKPYYTLSRQHVTSVTVTPHTGVLLTAT
jgi:hypothetical protein